MKHYVRDYPQYYCYLSIQTFFIKTLLNSLIFIIIVPVCEKQFMENDSLVNIYKMSYTNQN